MEVPMSWLVGSVLATVILILIQPFLLQISVALTGEPAPRYGRAAVTWIVATLLGTVASIGFSFTLGWMVPQVVTGIVSTLLVIGTTAIVFKRQFGTTLVQGMAVALIYSVLAGVLSAVTWYFVG